MNSNAGIYGRKLGCTQLFREDGNVDRVTVIKTGPVTVLGKRTPEKDGYTALVLGFEDLPERKVNKPTAGYFKKVGQPAKRIVKELRCVPDFAAKYEPGQVMKLDEIFTVGQKVDAKSRTRGRGFTGVVRRWDFAGFVQTHGTHEYRRHGGSIGTNMTPGRTLPNLKMPGHYGDETVSILNLVVARIDAEKHLLMVKGGVPGAKNSVVLVRHAVKTPKKRPGAGGPVPKKKG
jgi:large subunit ribosomal protein L3